MTTLVKKYPVFEDNQVLTSTQLNNLVEYLDQQNRLTRTSLIGVGVVCGLELDCQSTQQGEVLTISKGVGVTSEGYLIKQGNCELTQMRPYVLPEVVQYPPFEDPETGLQDISLQELLTENAILDEQDEVAPINKADLQDKVVLLYVECIDKDLKSCLGKSCDELGIDRLINVRKLLISIEDLQIVMDRTNGGFQETEFPDRFNLPEVTMPRALFLADSAASRNYLFYSLNYVLPIATVFNDILSAVDQATTTFQPILDPIYGTHPLKSDQIEKVIESWKEYLMGQDSNPIPYFGVQYFYDFMKDLILAYREFRDTACQLMSLCCPDSTRFPKHLSLGFVDPTLQVELPFNPRHTFTQSPIYNNQKQLMEDTIRLHQRIILLIEKFDLGFFNYEKLQGIAQDTDAINIGKITPSCEKKSNLSQRSIPYYYQINQKSIFEKLGNLQSVWRRNKNQLDTRIVAWENHKYGERFVDPITTPLDFDLDTYDFLRIEGHIGKPVRNVVEEMERFVKSRNMEVAIQAVYLGARGLQMPTPECLCADLQPDYSTWRYKTNYFLKGILALVVRLEELYKRSKKVNKVVTESVNKEGSIWKAKTATNENENIDFAALARLDVSVNRNNLNLLNSEFNKVNKNIEAVRDKPKDSDSTIPEALRKLLKILEEFSACLKDLIASMTVDFKDFNMNRWISKYQCVLALHIKVIKLTSEFVNDNEQKDKYAASLIAQQRINKMLNSLAIYPYIAIRILADTRAYRIEKMMESFQLSRYLRRHPGAEHKAGVAPGGTFVLVYQGEVEEQDFSPGDFLENPIMTKVNTDKVFKTLPNLQQGDFSGLKNLKEFEGRIVGDFTLPYMCCDDCGDMPNAAIRLKPLATPFMRVVEEQVKVTTVLDGEQVNQVDRSYEELKIKLLCDVYDQQVYRTQITSTPQFGEFKIEQRTSIEPGKQAEVLRYRVSPDLLRINGTGSFVEVEQLNYNYVDESGEVVGSSEICIFIPVHQNDQDQQTTAFVEISVAYNYQEAKLQVEDADLSVVGHENVQFKNLGKGIYQASNVPVGRQEFIAQHPRLIMARKHIVNVVAPNTKRSELLMRTPIIVDLEVGFEKRLDTLGIIAESAEAAKIRESFLNNMTDYSTSTNEIVEKQGAKPDTPLYRSRDLIEQYSSNASIAGKKLSASYSENRNELLKEIERANPKEKVIYTKVLENLTLAYLERLKVSEPDKFNMTTRRTLRETSQIVNGNADLKPLGDRIKAWTQESKDTTDDQFDVILKKDLRIKI